MDVFILPKYRLNIAILFLAFTMKLIKMRYREESSPIFQKANHPHDTRGTKRNIFVSHSNTRSITHIAPKTWNALPSNLKRCPSIASFKDNSKVDFIRSYSKFLCNRRLCQSCSVRTSTPSVLPKWHRSPYQRHTSSPPLDSYSPILSTVFFSSLLLFKFCLSLS